MLKLSAKRRIILTKVNVYSLAYRLATNNDATKQTNKQTSFMGNSEESKRSAHGRGIGNLVWECIRGGREHRFPVARRRPYSKIPVDV